MTDKLPPIDASGFQVPHVTQVTAYYIHAQQEDLDKVGLAHMSLEREVSGYFRVAAMMTLFDQMPLSQTPDIQNISKEDMTFRLRLFEEERKEMYAALGIDATTEFDLLSRGPVQEEASDLFSLEWAIRESDQSRWNIVEFADGIGDLKVILNGTAFRFAIPQDLVDWEIHCSNMTKFDDDGNVIRREDGKILKGKNYVAPNIRRIMGLEDVQILQVETAEGDSSYESGPYEQFDPDEDEDLPEE